MIVWGKLVHFTPQTNSNSIEEGVTTCKHDVFEEVAAEGHVAFHYRVVDVLLDALGIDVGSFSFGRVKEDLRGAESLLAQDYFPAIGENVGLLAGLRFISLLNSLFEVLNTVGHRFFHAAQLVDLCRCRENFSNRVTEHGSVSSHIYTSVQQLLQLLSHVLTRDIHALNAAWNSVTFINGN